MIFPDWLFYQVALALILLFYAAYSDLKTHEVANGVWLVLGAGGVLIAVVSFGPTAMLLSHLAFSGAIVLGSLAVWYFAANFIGAADIKALMALGFCVPFMMLTTIGYTAVLAMAYLGFKFLRGTKAKDLLRIQVPFMPILFLGLFASVVAFVLTPSVAMV